MSNKKGISRKRFLARLALGATGIAGGSWALSRLFSKPTALPIPGKIMGASAKTGHLLREGGLPEATRTIDIPTLIIGAGVSGLSAAWHLERFHKRDDYLILELEDYPGGNAASGENEVSAYPWGAHYLPVPGPEDETLIALLQELGVVKEIKSDGSPVFDSLYLCHSPRERLLLHGRWQDGILPQFGVPAGDLEQINAFQAHIAEWQMRKGSDGRYAFRIPLDLSSADPEIRALDGEDMRSYLMRQGWDSKYLFWYVNYCCRDDFGTPMAQTSAWAGLHYFASRRKGGSNAATGSVLTWPEGNGWLIRNWLPLLRGKVQCNALVTQLKNVEGGVEAIYYDIERKESVRVRAEQAIYAGPRFAAAYLIPELNKNAAQGFSYAPWMVANITLKNRPSGPGQPLSWDNVAYESNSLGYVLSDHQSMDRKPRQAAVITWYQPLDDQAPKEARKSALEKPYEEWQAMVIADLEIMHPGIREHITRVDVWLWGHGMIRPVPGFIWGNERKKASIPLGNIRFAHSDLSGISIFEEAFYQGGRCLEGFSTEQEMDELL